MESSASTCDLRWLDNVHRFMVSRRVDSINFNEILQHVPYEESENYKCIKLIRKDPRFKENASMVSLVTQARDARGNNRQNKGGGTTSSTSVSYTHLTLPTSDLV